MLNSIVLDSNVIHILINLTGWIIVMILAKDYLNDVRSIKEKYFQMETQHNHLMLEQKLQAQKILFIEKNIEHINMNIAEIKQMISDNNEHLIEELKIQLRKH
jgi:hypothetical protein